MIVFVAIIPIVRIYNAILFSRQLPDDIHIGNGKRWLVACGIVTESAASDATC
jgi:hypothetical protein